MLANYFALTHQKAATLRNLLCAGNAEQLGKVCWLPNRIILCMKSDVELRAHIIEVAMKDGLLGPQATAGQAAAAWVRLWVTANQLERDALMQLLRQRSTIQVQEGLGPGSIGYIMAV